MTLLLLLPSVAMLPMLLLCVLAVALFLVGLYWILTLIPPTAPYASKVTLIAAVFIALYFVISMLGAV